MRRPGLALLLLFPALLAAQSNSLSAKEVNEGWVLLFDGESQFGWHADGGESGWLRSGGVFGDFVLKCEFRTSAKGNSGLFIRSAKEGRPHVTGYEVQIWNDHPKFPTGSLVNHVATPKKAELRCDQWNSFEIRAEGDRFAISLNGKKVLEAKEGKSAAGHIGLQYNKDNKI